ncbi:hypothetical protein [Anaeromicropila herbilytica]|uniref:Uncharacterized protein n=1 Tax=Anaeromicropila herbilytica TaxID=2785025 RepID=A0A7R7EHT1_9FIRM|nr:hypothetical protein [Anaeromicropila herbilytica]BCN28978.1 hypothetical protein bsdtb5_02730 [Anaeromicropila herbilytica]
MEDFSYRILLFAIVILIIVILYSICRYAYFMKKEHFVCPNCKKSNYMVPVKDFKPKAF